MFAFTSNECDDPDIREKGFIYWRLVDMDPSIASAVVLSEKPRISEEDITLSGEVLEKLVESLGSLATVYQKTPEQFVRKCKGVNIGEEEEAEIENETFKVQDEGIEYNEDKDIVNKSNLDVSEISEINYKNDNTNISNYNDSYINNESNNNIDNLNQTGKLIDIDIFSNTFTKDNKPFNMNIQMIVS